MLSSFLSASRNFWTIRSLNNRSSGTANNCLRKSSSFVCSRCSKTTSTSFLYGGAGSFGACWGGSASSPAFGRRTNEIDLENAVLFLFLPLKRFQERSAQIVYVQLLTIQSIDRTGGNEARHLADCHPAGELGGISCVSGQRGRDERVCAQHRSRRGKGKRCSSHARGRHG
jgi:hypothetical protein